jgi:hypothetical protein
MDLFIPDLDDVVSASPNKSSQTTDSRVEGQPKDRYDQMTEDAIRTEAKDRNITRVGVKGIKRLKDELRTQDFKRQLVKVSM